MAYTTSFRLDQDVADLLEDFKQKYKIPKTTVINYLLKYYIEHQEELYEILTGD